MYSVIIGHHEDIQKYKTYEIDFTDKLTEQHYTYSGNFGSSRQFAVHFITI